MTVEILATCRNLELLAATLLVFKTLRTGFPTWKARVYGNGLPKHAEYLVGVECVKNGCEFSNVQPMRHDEWISKLLKHNRQPFVICDTDMIFYESVESWQFENPFAGAYQPEFLDPYSQCVHIARLHTSLLFIRPDEVRDRAIRFAMTIPNTPVFNVKMDFVKQQIHPVSVGAVSYKAFLDTLATLYQAIHGQHFTQAQMDCYTHLNCGTWSDLRSDGLREFHEVVYKDFSKARGLWRKLELFYQEHPSPL
jgi:hypothetical protein